MPPRVCVITPARDAAATLPALFAALAAQDVAFEHVVVDDGSTDATRALAEGYADLVLAGGGRGPGAARNLAAAATTCEVLAFTDADCAPEPGWLRAGLAALDAGADVVQGRVVPDGALGPWDRSVSVGGFTGLFETANLLVRRDWFTRVGGFEPWLSPARSKELAEDVWLGWRMRRSGARTVFAPDAVVRHAVLPGTPWEWVAERARTRYFPPMAARVPELRDVFLHRRWFLSPRSAHFDAAVAGAATGAVLAARGRPRAGTAVAASAAAPYVRDLWGGSRYWGRRQMPLVLLTRLAADVVTLAALAAGSARARRVVL